jgi:hypothetical protein
VGGENVTRNLLFNSLDIITLKSVFHKLAIDGIIIIKQNVDTL